MSTRFIFPSYLSAVLPVILLAQLGAAGGARAAKEEACADTFYGTVNYDDVTDQGQRVARQEKFKFRSWSAEEQFDEILVKLSPEIRSGSGVQVRVVFSTSADAGAKEKKSEIVRAAALVPWHDDQKFSVLGQLNMKHLVRHEAAGADRFTLVAEKDGREICARVYPITRSD